MRDAFAERMRAAVAALLPEGAFLRRDRGKALYVTDAPRRGAVPDFAAVGFECRVAEGLARLWPGAVWMAALSAEYPEPPDFLCASMKRFDGPPDAAALILFAEGMKALDGGGCGDDYGRRLRARAAVCLRKGINGGGLYACALVYHRMHKERSI